MTHSIRRSIACLVAPIALAACGDGGTTAGDSATDSIAAVTATATPSALLSTPDRTITRGEVTINYRVMGAGEPILLVHGYGDRLEMWAGFADSLARENQVIVVDTRGFGRSSKPAGEKSYGLAMVDDLVVVLDQEKATRAHVVGYSMGALLAANLALLHPDRVSSAALVAGGYLPSPDSMRKWIAPYVADLAQGRRLERLLRDVVPALPDSQVKPFSDQIVADGDSAALLGVMQSFPALTPDWSKVPTSGVTALIIIGANDPLVPYSRDLAERWPKAKLVEVAGTDHMTLIASPQLLREVRALTGPRVVP
jgi:pimeloyl-ACP methyl ester carboxylesterase